MVMILEGNQDHSLNGIYEVSSISGDMEREEIFLSHTETGELINIGVEPGMIPDEVFDRCQCMVVGNTAYFE